MRYLLTIALVGMLATTALAVDQKPKQGVAQPAPAAKDTVRAPAKEKKSSKAGLLEKLKRDLQRQQSGDSTKRFDEYIDANNDGVDDRVGRTVKPVEKVQEPKPVSADSTESKAKPKREKP